MVARVKISTSMLIAARRLASSTMYTFMPPASPVPGWCSGEVWTLSIATRRGLRWPPGSRSRGGPARVPANRDTYWLTRGPPRLGALPSDAERACGHAPPKPRTPESALSFPLCQNVAGPVGRSPAQAGSRRPGLAKHRGDLRNVRPEPPNRPARTRRTAPAEPPSHPGRTAEPSRPNHRAVPPEPPDLRVRTAAYPRPMAPPPSAKRPVGTVTRGTTNPNRLRRMDRWIAAAHGAALRRAAAPVAVDLGYGAAPWTARRTAPAAAHRRPRRLGGRHRDRAGPGRRGQAVRARGAHLPARRLRGAAGRAARC